MDLHKRPVYIQCDKKNIYTFDMSYLYVDREEAYFMLLDDLFVLFFAAGLICFLFAFMFMSVIEDDNVALFFIVFATIFFFCFVSFRRKFHKYKTDI